jgi:nucleotide-binding universal stress UspA family protein
MLAYRTLLRPRVRILVGAFAGMRGVIDLSRGLHRRSGHGWLRDGERSGATGGRVRPALRREARAAQRIQVRSTTARLGRGRVVLPPRGPTPTAVDEGDPADVLVRLANECSADVLVIGNKGMQRKVLGSVPNSVTHKADCSVFVVKTT